MLTNEDIKNLTEYQKGVFATKDDVAGLGQHLGQRIDVLTNAVDAYAKKADTYHQEMSVLIHKVHRMEDWITKVSDKIGIKYV
ncbi:MAG: hypothetical protein ABIJ81_03520 [Patescibacteria group bacterium]